MLRFSNCNLFHSTFCYVLIYFTCELHIDQSEKSQSLYYSLCFTRAGVISWPHSGPVRGKTVPGCLAQCTVLIFRLAVSPVCLSVCLSVCLLVCLSPSLIVSNPGGSRGPFSSVIRSWERLPKLFINKLWSGAPNQDLQLRN